MLTSLGDSSGQHFPVSLTTPVDASIVIGALSADSTISVASRWFVNMFLSLMKWSDFPESKFQASLSSSLVVDNTVRNAGPFFFWQCLAIWPNLWQCLQFGPLGCSRTGDLGLVNASMSVVHGRPSCSSFVFFFFNIANDRDTRV